MVLVSLLAMPLAAGAAQFCLSESQVPTSTPTSRFTDHSDGTVTDAETGMMWAKCAQGSSGAGCSVGVWQILNWGAALQAAESSELAGYTDWRLPNIKELHSIVELRCGNPAVNLAVFPSTPETEFWSSSPSTFDSSAAWALQFIIGGSVGTYLRNELHAVRLVRGGS